MTEHEAKEKLICYTSDPCAYDHTCKNHQVLAEVQADHFADKEATVSVWRKAHDEVVSENNKICHILDNIRKEKEKKEEEIAKLEARNKKLREALEKILFQSSAPPCHVIAEQALKEEKKELHHIYNKPKNVGY